MFTDQTLDANGGPRMEPAAALLALCAPWDLNPEPAD